MLWLLLFVVMVPLIVWQFFVFKRPCKYPPGPIFRIPIYGQGMYLRGGKVEGHKKLRQQYGDVYSLKLGNRVSIFVSELSIMKKLLNLDIFSHRVGSTPGPHFKRIQQQWRGGDGNHGIIRSSGKVWKEQRCFTLRSLRDFGLCKKQMEERIIDEVNELSEKWKLDLNNNNNELPINWMTFNMSIMNGLWGIISSRRFNLNNQEGFEKFEKINGIFASWGNSPLRWIFSYALPERLRKFDAFFNQVINDQHNIYDWFAQEYQEHLKTYDENDLRDYIDCYIKERQKADHENDKEYSFYGDNGHWNFVNSMFDLFIAGAETTGTTLQWAISYLIHYPDVQKRAQKELDEVVGRKRLANLSDKDNLPYMEALVAEVHRCGDVLPFSVTHEVSQDIEIDGIFYAKDSRIAPNLSAILSDPNNFNNPEKFDPERFLCKKTGRFIAHPALVVFGVGKRECLGKSLAKLEIYLFLAGLLHQFNFFPSEKGLPDLTNANEFITRGPKPYHCKVIAREL